jgi:signal transduction histidine kinase
LSSILARATVIGKSLAKIENELILERKQRQLDRDRWIFIGIAALIGFILTILGLRMVHDLVKANGYELTVESKPKAGSIFKLHFRLN